MTTLIAGKYFPATKHLSKVHYKKNANYALLVRKIKLAFIHKNSVGVHISIQLKTWPSPEIKARKQCVA